MAYQDRQLNTDYNTATAGFLVVRLIAHNTNDGTRVVVAECKVGGVVVASGSAADNYVADVISSGTQTFTVPIPATSTYRVDRTSGEGDVEIRWCDLLP